MKPKNEISKLVAKSTQSVGELEKRVETSPPDIGKSDLEKILRKHKNVNKSLQYLDSDAMRNRLEENRKRIERESKTTFLRSNLIRIVALMPLLVIAIVARGCNG